MKEFIEHIAKQLVDEPESVVVEERPIDENNMELTLKVAKNDIGKVIGKQGRNVQAMRTLLTAIGAKQKVRTKLEIVE